MTDNADVIRDTSAGKAVNQASNTNHTVANLVFTVLRIYLLQPSKFIDRHFVERTLFGCILLTSWFIGAIYGSGLASAMTVPRYLAPIDTPVQLAESNMQWSATHDAWIFSIQSATHPLLVTLVQHFKIRNQKELRMRSLEADIGFSIERLPFGHFAIGDYIQEDVLDNYQIMIEDIYWEYCVAMSYKTWSLMPNFDLLVMEVAQSGIQKYWELV
uniref:Ionotropic glutamate receptor C-terminal domain-containing protein n=1 Tax=Lutzomyia longipalpis TaxID=7200 RepID=A0A1B0CF95_LUTLO